MRLWEGKLERKGYFFLKLQKGFFFKKKNTGKGRVDTFDVFVTCV